MTIGYVASASNNRRTTVRAIPFTVTFPGSSPDLRDPTLDGRTQQMLTLGLDALVDAAIALGEYRAVAYSVRVFSDTELRTITAERERIAAEIRSEQVDTDARKRPGCEDLMHEVHRRLIPEMMARGIAPALFESRPPFIYARTFVLSIEMLRRAFVQIEQERGTASPGATAVRALDAAVPGLVGVRHSVSHADERVLRTRRGKPIHPKPIEHGAVRSTTGGVMMLGSLIGDCFGYTTETGDYAEVPIKLDTHVACVAAYQTLVTNLRWRGTPHVVPAM